jgi:hypothetical protein
MSMGQMFTRLHTPTPASSNLTLHMGKGGSAGAAVPEFYVGSEPPADAHGLPYADHLRGHSVRRRADGTAGGGSPGRPTESLTESSSLLPCLERPRQ